MCVVDEVTFADAGVDGGYSSGFATGSYADALPPMPELVRGLALAPERVLEPVLRLELGPG